jgi:hypothetical protein
MRWRDMLWTCFVALLFLWFIGVATSLTMNGFIHVLPLAAAGVALAGSFQRRQLV